MSFEDYGELSGVGFQGAPDAVPPEEEFFKSIYIAGVTRKNHINIEEEAGKFQIRGLEYNLDKVHMVITHTKEILVREAEKNTRALFSCFSFKDGQPPWHGTSKLADDRFRPCPSTSAERAVNEFCAPCRGQILVGGICCKEDGTPVTDGEGKPVFVFLRGKGTKYGNISSYLGEMFKLDLSPIFEPVTEQSQAFEKAVVNNKRFVTTITLGQTDTSFGPKNVFVLNKGVELAKESVMNILGVSKKTLDKFNAKFDWSTRARAASAPPADGVLPMDAEPKDKTIQGDAEPEKQEASAPTEEKKEDTAQKTFSFDNIEF